jgi:hypothetical protein
MLFFGERIEERISMRIYQTRNSITFRLNKIHQVHIALFSPLDSFSDMQFAEEERERER